MKKLVRLGAYKNKGLRGGKALSSEVLLRLYERLDGNNKECALMAVRQISAINDVQEILETLKKLSGLQGADSRNAPPIPLGQA